MDEDTRSLLDNLLREAELERANLRAERERIEGVERLAVQRVTHLRALLDLDRRASSDAETPVDGMPVESNGARRLEDIAAEVLSEAGPLHYRDLYNRCAERGESVSSKKPEAVLLTRISRDPRFQRTGRRGW